MSDNHLMDDQLRAIHDLVSGKACLAPLDADSPAPDLVEIEAAISEQMVVTAYGVLQRLVTLLPTAGPRRARVFKLIAETAKRYHAMIAVYGGGNGGIGDEALPSIDADFGDGALNGAAMMGSPPSNSAESFGAKVSSQLTAALTVGKEAKEIETLVNALRDARMSGETGVAAKIRARIDGLLGGEPSAAPAADALCRLYPPPVFSASEDLTIRNPPPVPVAEKRTSDGD